MNYMGIITSKIKTNFINVGPPIIQSSPFSSYSSSTPIIIKKSNYSKCIYCNGTGLKYDIKYFIQNNDNPQYTRKIPCGYCNGVGYVYNDFNIIP